MEYIHLGLYFLLIFPSCLCFEPVSISTFVGIVGGLAISAGYAGWQYAKCNYEECCTDKWMKLNRADLSEKLKNKLYGQHLVEDVVVRTIHGHIRNPNPQKALVMSFHGSSGIGKNFVSHLMVESLYKKGIKSNFVHLYVSTVHFPHKRLVREYRDKLQKEVREATRQCQRSLFIFDEIDKMPPGVIDVLKPYMDHYNEIDGVDYRKNIFIFLSNAGANDISMVTLKFWSEGLQRTDITLKDMERLVNRGAFNEIGGLYGTDIIRKNLIDIYVPFLPLERKHVQQCIEDKLRERYKEGYLQSGVDMVLDQIEFIPPRVQIFAESGCKRIEQKINIFFDV